MTKIIIFEGTEYTIQDCTAIADCDMESGNRQNALLVENEFNGETFQFVVFGFPMPEDAEDFANMCSESSAWESDWETLNTVQIRRFTVFENRVESKFNGTQLEEIPADYAEGDPLTLGTYDTKEEALSRLGKTESYIHLKGSGRNALWAGTIRWIEEAIYNADGDFIESLGCYLNPVDIQQISGEDDPEE